MVFDTFERMVAFRYLRARRQEGFISVIAIFSLLGIMLGVATLIIVMAVMNGFRVELLSRIIGLNGHLGIYAPQGAVTDYDALAQRMKQVPGVVAVHPLIEGQVLASAKGRSTGVLAVSYTHLTLPTAQLYFQLPNAVTTLQVFVTDPDQARAIGYAIRQQLGGQYQVYDWQQSNSAYFGAVQVERNVMFIILSLIILVAAFNIISSMIMLVKDKTRDIAILRTMGATRGMILRIFMLSGASIGVVGTLLGFGLGVAFTTHIEQIRQLVQDVLHVNVFNAEIYFLTQIPARIDPHEVVTVLAMAFGLSFLATLYPSWRAARLDPVEALRYE